jgi:hypothetical protein
MCNSNLRISLIIAFQVLDGTLLPDVLPDDVVGMTLALKVLAQGFYRFPGWEQPFELRLRSSFLFLFVLGEDLQVDLGEVVEALQERRDTLLILGFTAFLGRLNCALRLLLW